jgi:hypothetical protein
LSVARTKNETGIIACLESRRATDELVEFQGVEVNIIEGRCHQHAESRGVDTGHKVLQVFVGPPEPKLDESREDKASWWRWRTTFLVMMVCKFFKSK